MIIAWQIGAVVAPQEYYGLGFAWNGIGTPVAPAVIQAAVICATLVELTRLDVTLDQIATLAVTLVELSRLDVTLTIPEC